MIRPLVLAVLLSVLAGSPAAASCVMNGIVYPEGAVVGAFVCRGGRWHPR